MAVRTVKADDTLKVDVLMKTGKQFLGCDAGVINDTPQLFAFWVGDRMKVVSWDNIAAVDFYNEETSAE